MQADLNLSESSKKTKQKHTQIKEFSRTDNFSAILGIMLSDEEGSIEWGKERRRTKGETK